VTFTAAAGPCPNPWYEFWLQPPSSTTWQLAQGYSTNNVFIWNTAGLIGGTYSYAVYARDASSPGVTPTFLGAFDWAVGINTYSFAAAACTSQPTATVSPSYGPPGTTVVFNMQQLGCSAQYAIWIRRDPSTTWLLAYNYNSNPMFGWNTALLPSGTYYWVVWVRDVSSLGRTCDSLGCFDTSINPTPYVLSP